MAICWGLETKNRPQQHANINAADPTKEPENAKIASRETQVIDWPIALAQPGVKWSPARPPS